MIKIVHGDLLLSNADLICHQVNCQGVMGSGVAKQIKEKWPEVFREYRKLCTSHSADKEALLGTVQMIKVEEATTVCNIFGQLDFGRDGSCYTHIDSLKIAFKTIANNLGSEKSVAMPHRIGCGLGGGDWGAVMNILAENFHNYNLTLYKL